MQLWQQILAKQTGAAVSSPTVVAASGRLWAWGLPTTGQLGITGMFSIAQVSSGGNHQTAITSDGRLFAWGLNSAGQLGDGTTANKSNPVQIGGNTSWRSVSAGGSYTMAIRSDGKLFAWGVNTQGQLGLNQGVNARIWTPTKVGDSSWSQVNAGGSHVLAIKSDGTLWSWGFSATGQLGLSTGTPNRSSPSQIGAGSWSAISAGIDHSLGIDSTGALYGWGINTVNQTGIYGLDTPLQHAGMMMPGFNLLEATGFIKNNGQLFTMGNNDYGSLGINAAGNRSSPVQVAGSWTQVAFVVWSAFGIKSGGTLWSWGLNSNGILGINDTINRSSPVQIGSGIWKFINIYINSSSQQLIYAIDNTNALYAWGGNGGSGDVLLGDGNIRTLTSSPVQIGNASWSMISGSLGLRTDGTLWSWGTNGSGELGQNDTITRSSMTQIGSQSNWTVIAGGVGNFFVGGADGISYFAINDLGELYSWGYNAKYALGLTDSLNRSTPTKVGSSSWVAVSNGGSKSMGIDVFGKLYMWGASEPGDSGFFGVTTLSQPVQLAAGTSFIAIPSKFNSAKAATAITGIVFRWGANGTGQLGFGNTINRSSPTQLGTPALFGVNLATSVSSPTQVRATPNGISSWSQVSAGISYSIALTDDRKLFAWGLGTSGQLGDGSATTKTSNAMQIPGNNWSVVSAGAARTLGVTRFGRLYAWGVGTSGALGTGDAVNRSVPTQIGSSSWTVVSTSDISNNTVGATIAGGLFGWGAGANGTVGDNTVADKNTPAVAAYTTNIQAYIPNQVGTSSWTQVATGASHTVGILITNTLYAWGLNNAGQLGVTATGDTINRSSPTQVGTSSWVAVSSGEGSHTVAIRSDKTLWAWGLNSSGQLGDNTTNNKSSPVQISYGNSSWVVVSAGEATAAGITISSTLFTWGAATSGILGDNTVVNKSSPTQVLGSWASVSVGPSHVLAIRSDSTLWAWGLATSGQLGDGSIISKSYPVQVGSSSWLQVSAGDLHSLGITSDKKLYAWGAGTLGQTGILTESKSWTQIAQGNGFTLAKRDDGTIWSWGTNTNGPLATNDTLNRSSPTQIGTSSWSQVFVSLSSTYAGAIKGDGSLWAWGLNSSGQLGDGTTINRSSPVQVLQTTEPNSWISVDGGNDFTVGITSNGKLWGWGSAAGLTIAPPAFSWSQISQNSTRTIAIRNDGMLFTWGLNNAGQLGIGDSVNRSSPVQVGWSSWSLVSSGASHTLAVRSDGTLFAWGLNSSYQLGIIDSFNRSSPTQVNASSWSQISAGDFHSTGIANNLLYAWGLGTSGQLGELTENLSWTSIDAGTLGATGVSGSGSLFTWGSNSFGALGTLDTLNRSSPVQTTASSWTQSTVGVDSMLATDIFGAPYTWGRNNSGQLGNGTTFNRSYPTQILQGGSIPVDLSNYSSTNKITKVNNLGYSTSIIPFSNTISGTFNLGLGGTLTPIDHIYVTNAASTWMTALGDWTFEAWIYPTSFSGPQFSCAIITFGADDVILRLLPTTAVTTNLNLFAINTANESIWGPGIGGGTVYLNQWQHVAATRQSGVFTVWLNGVIAVTDAAVTTSNIRTTTPRLSVGKGYASENNYFIGYISNVRVVNEAAAYTAPFTPPKTRLTTSQSANVNGSPSAAISASQTAFLTFTTTNSVNTSAQLNYSQVSAGGSFSLAIDSASRLWSWGVNTNGRLGLGDVLDRSYPVQIGTSSWSQVSAGLSTGAAIDISGKLYVWGYGLSGQIGQGTNTDRSSPTQVGTSSWTQVALGPNTQHILAIKTDGSLWAWGQNNVGQLGTNNGTTTSSPVAVAAAGVYTQIAVGDFHSLAIKNDGSLWAWGKNDVYQLGFTTNTVARSSPTQIGTSSWSQVTAGVSFTLARDINGNVYGWGLGTTGQLGLNDAVSRSVPTIVGSVLPNAYISPNQVGTSSYAHVNAGVSYTLAIRSDNTLWAWGLGTGGQLGDNSAITKSLPVQIGSLTNWVDVTAGATHSGAIDTAGKLYMWGTNAAGLGVTAGGDTVARSSPTIVSGTTSWKAVSAGASHTAAIDSTNKLWAWGLNNAGQLGAGAAGDTINRSSPVLIGSSSWAQISAGTSYTGAIDSIGRLLTWGLGTTGEIGINLATSRSSPTQVGSYLAAGSIVQPIDLTLTSWSQVNAGISFTTALAQNKTLWTWGFGTQGQLGLGNTTTRSSPSQVGSSSWSQVSAGGDHAIGLTIVNTIFAWGGNAGGQLGQGNVTNLSVPTAVLAAGATSSFTAVAAGISYSLAAAVVNGTLWGWGLNTSGQLGDSTAVSKSTANIINSNSITPRDRSTYAGNPAWNWSRTGRAHVVAINPFSAPYNDTSLYGGSIYFPDLSASNLNAPLPGSVGANHIHALADLTMECWVFRTANFSGNSFDAPIFGTDAVQWGSLCINAGGQVTMDQAGSGVKFRGSVLALGQWYHIAMSRRGISTTVFVNGAIDTNTVGTGNPFTTYAASIATPTTGGSVPNLMYIGKMPSQAIPGLALLLHGLRYSTKAIYTGPFTVPTSPLGVTGAAGTNIEEVSPGDVTFLFACDLVPYHGSFTQISAGPTNAAATTSIGRAVAWGAGTTGQLAEVVRNISRSNLSQVGAVYPLVNVSTPTAVSEALSWTAVSAGKSYSMAIRSDYKLFAWGANPNGLLGTGDSITRSNPIQIGTLSWSQINASISHTAGITTT
jgi:alpha-tubulin suppressor-like RCC1 family protein